MIPSGLIKNVCRAANFITTTFDNEPYLAETSRFVSANSVKHRPSLAQNSLWLVENWELQRCSQSYCSGRFVVLGSRRGL
jgi:hypothetical protein